MKRKGMTIEKLGLRVTAKLDTEDGLVVISKSDKYDIVHTSVTPHFEARISENRFLWRGQCYYNSSQLLNAMNRNI